MVTLAILGYTGHFGKIIFDHISLNLKNCHFYLLSRNPVKINSDRIRTYTYDFKKDSALPDFPQKPDLLLDLTGPVSTDSPLVFEASLRAGIPYMDISMDVSHIANCQEVFQKNKKGCAIVHTGLFPGFSNLMISELITQMPANSTFTLAGEFPAYAGGGLKVAQTFRDLLKKSEAGYYFSNGQKIHHALHEGPVQIMFRGKTRNLYRWFLPEVTSLERSLRPRNFSRLIIIKPGILNRPFRVFMKILSFLPFHNGLIAIIQGSLYFFKKFIFYKFNPKVSMEATGSDNNSTKNITLETENGPTLHGNVMFGFVTAFLKLPNRKNLQGVFTPEQLFSIEDILQYGKFKDYNLSTSSIME